VYTSGIKIKIQIPSISLELIHVVLNSAEGGLGVNRGSKQRTWTLHHILISVFIGLPMMTMAAVRITF
jgi:hypothetical protein